MKRVLALLLALVTVFAAMAMCVGCAGETEDEDEDHGAEVSAVLVCGEIYDFDPAKAYTNDAAMKVMSLIYEPLFTLDANGNVQYALANGYRFYKDRGEFKMDVTLRETYWNDGSQVTALDICWAWWRILSQDFACQAATLLYDIKNARAAKLGDMSAEDVGVTDGNDPLVLTITFEKELDADAQQNFLRNLTSIALTPVKEQAVTKADREEVWSKRVSYIVTNGPFAIRAMDYGIKEGETFKSNNTAHEFRLERNSYYRRSQESILPEDTYVTPYKFLSYWNTDFTESFAEDIENTVFIAGDIPVEERETYLSRAKISNLLSTYTYVLDNNDPVFANADVRRALSMVIDRETLAAELTKGLAVPATGFVSHGVLNGNSGSFSEATAADSEVALSVKANKEEAVKLLKDAKKEGYEGGAIRILVRDDAEEVAIANAVADLWRSLFREAGVSCNISVTKKSYELITFMETDTPITLCNDAIQEAYRTSASDTSGFNGYNVLAIDYQMLSPDAFSALASFSLELSGNGIFAGGLEESRTLTHVCGFNNEAYNKLIDDAYAAPDMAKRTELLHEAEALLLEEMPVIPLFFNRSALLVKSDLQRVYTDFYGHPVLTRAELRNYHNHLLSSPVTGGENEENA